MDKISIRIMGESDIVDVTMLPAGAAPKPSPLLMGLDGNDKINLLGHWMDQDRGAALAEDPVHLEAMTIIASEFLAGHALAKECVNGANFVLLTILREKWPVGSKAKYKILADRVGAAHTYLAHPCAAAKLDDLTDQDSLKQSETQQLAMALGFYKANRKRFANSSAVQGLIKQA
jgi:hypothetical protein